MDTQIDEEPHRSVQLIRRIDTRIPTPLLSASASLASPSVLGKLADLRAPKAVAGSGRWTAVVTKPGSGSSSPVPSLGGIGGQVGAADVIGAGGAGAGAAASKPSSGVWVS